MPVRMRQQQAKQRADRSLPNEFLKFVTNIPKLCIFVTMKRILIFTALAFGFASCQKAAKTPVFTYTCTIYAISTATGDTSVHRVDHFVDSPTPPAAMADSISQTVNGGNHPFSFIICN